MEKLRVLELSVSGEEEAVFRQVATVIEALRAITCFEVIRLTDIEGETILVFKNQ